MADNRPQTTVNSPQFVFGTSKLILFGYWQESGHTYIKFNQN